VRDVHGPLQPELAGLVEVEPDEVHGGGDVEVQQELQQVEAGGRRPVRVRRRDEPQVARGPPQRLVAEPLLGVRAHPPPHRLDPELRVAGQHDADRHRDVPVVVVHVDRHVDVGARAGVLRVDHERVEPHDEVVAVDHLAEAAAEQGRRVGDQADRLARQVVAEGLAVHAADGRGHLHRRQRRHPRGLRERLEQRQVAVEAVRPLGQVLDDTLGQEALLVTAVALPLAAGAQRLGDGERAQPRGVVALGRRGPRPVLRGVAAGVRLRQRRRAAGLGDEQPVEPLRAHPVALADDAGLRLGGRVLGRHLEHAAAPQVRVLPVPAVHREEVLDLPRRARLRRQQDLRRQPLGERQVLRAQRLGRRRLGAGEQVEPPRRPVQQAGAHQPRLQVRGGAEVRGAIPQQRQRAVRRQLALVEPAEGVRAERLEERAVARPDVGRGVECAGEAAGAADGATGDAAGPAGLAGQALGLGGGAEQRLVRHGRPPRRRASRRPAARRLVARDRGVRR
jgi:hypothetical protein